MSLQLVNLQLIPTKFTANNNLHFSKKTKKTKKLQLNNKQIHKKVHKLKKNNNYKRVLKLLKPE